MQPTSFVNREKELEFLIEYINSTKTDFIPIYGRRRIGKTTLVKKAVENTNAIYFLSKKTSIQENINRFQQIINKNLQYTPIFSTFEDIIAYLKSLNKQLTIIIDEFPYLCELDSSIPSRFQYILDEITKNSKIKIFLLGSSISMMERETLSYKSPLYGRRQGSVKLKPLKFQHLQYFFPKASIEELVKIYGVVGGIPFYLENLKNKSFNQILKEVFNKYNIFYNEVDFLLKEELKDPKNYKLILQTIANGSNKFSDIATQTQLEKTSLNHYLEILENLEFIKKEKPYLESNKSKKTSYSLNDEFIIFWFRYINKYQENIEFEDFDFLQTFTKEYQQYLGTVYETIVKEFLSNYYGVTYQRQWGTYLGENRRNKSYEIDLMHINKEKRKISLCEVKYKTLYKKDIDEIYNTLNKKLQYLKLNLEEYKIEYIIFAKKIKEEINNNNIKCFDLNDLI